MRFGLKQAFCLEMKYFCFLRFSCFSLLSRVFCEILLIIDHGVTNGSHYMKMCDYEQTGGGGNIVI